MKAQALGFDLYAKIIILSENFKSHLTNEQLPLPSKAQPKTKYLPQ